MKFKSGFLFVLLFASASVVKANRYAFYNGFVQGSIRYAFFPSENSEITKEVPCYFGLDTLARVLLFLAFHADCCVNHTNRPLSFAHAESILKASACSSLGYLSTAVINKILRGITWQKNHKNKKTASFSRRWHKKIMGYFTIAKGVRQIKNNS